MLDAYGIPGLPSDPSVSGGLNTQAINGYLNLGVDNGMIVRLRPAAGGIAHPH